jgi:hypothetical protein
MVAARNAALVGLMLFLISAFLTLPVASAREVDPGLSKAVWGQPLPDRVLQNLSGKASLVGYGNVTDQIVQINQGGGNQVSTADVFSTHTTLSGPGEKTTTFDANTAKQFRMLMGFFNFKR